MHLWLPMLWFSFEPVCENLRTYDTYHMTNGAGSSTAVSAGQTRTPSSTPLVDLKVWSLKPDSAARGMEAIMGG